MTPSPLADWDNFYVIVGSAAAGLIGLTFVVISLAADAKRVTTDGLRTFVTPTIVHFGVVLALAAYLSAPHQSVTSLCVGFGVTGLAGLGYVIAVGAAMRRVHALYVPVGEDWIFNAVIPGLSYAALIAMAFVCPRDLEVSLYGVAVVTVVLLFTGMHNAWDVAVWNSIKKAKSGDADT